MFLRIFMMRAATASPSPFPSTSTSPLPLPSQCPYLPAASFRHLSVPPTTVPRPTPLWLVVFRLPSALCMYVCMCACVRASCCTLRLRPTFVFGGRRRMDFPRIFTTCAGFLFFLFLFFVFGCMLSISECILRTDARPWNLFLLCSAFNLYAVDVVAVGVGDAVAQRFSCASSTQWHF